MMRVAVLATALVAAVVGAVWAWSAHPDWLDPRAVLHPVQWAAIQRKAAGTGFPADVDSAKARILLVERGALWDDWLAKPHSRGACWMLGGAVRHWRVCAADGRVESIALTWPKEPAYPREHPDQAVVRAGIGLVLGVASPESGAAAQRDLLRRSEDIDLGPPMIVGAARIRGLYRPYGELYLETMPAVLPQPPDWTYRPPPPPEYLFD